MAKFLRRVSSCVLVLALSSLTVASAIVSPTELEQRQELVQRYSNGQFVDIVAFKEAQHRRQKELLDQKSAIDYPRAWNIVTRIIYVEAGAFDVDILLTDDPSKNCGIGCYISLPSDIPLIVINPYLDDELLTWVAYHELAHHRQSSEGTRFVEDIECDADLRAMESTGRKNVELSYYCEKAGLAEEQFDLSALPLLLKEHGSSVQ